MKTTKILLAGALALALIAPVGGTAVAAKDKKDVKKATKQIRDGRYVGTRGDGEPVDWIFCKNGKYSLDTGGGLSIGKKWKVSKASVRKSGTIAIVKGQGGLSVAIANLKKKGWQVGIEYFDEAIQLGPVKRTSAKEECKAL